MVITYHRCRIPYSCSPCWWYFVFLTLNFILTGVLDSIKQQRMFAIALDNRVKTMNNEIVRIDVKMCQAFGIQPDMDRIARADGQKDARKD